MKKGKFILLLLVATLLIGAAAFKLWQLAQVQDNPGLLVASGRIEGRLTTITPKSSGWLREIKADEGQQVTKGSLLAILDDEAQRQRTVAATENVKSLTQQLRSTQILVDILRRSVPLQITGAQIALKQEKDKHKKVSIIYDQAKKEAGRYQRLADQKSSCQELAEQKMLQASVSEKEVAEACEDISHAENQLALALLGEQEIEAKQAECDALASRIAMAKAVLAEQQSYLDDFVIRSPLDGTVLTRTVELGERVNVGTPLFTLVDLNRLYLKVYIPEPDIGKVIIGQEARVYVDAYPDRYFPARISKLSQQAEFTPKNVETREERVKLVFAVELALLKNDEGILKPGMPADGILRWQKDAEWKQP